MKNEMKSVINMIHLLVEHEGITFNEKFNAVRVWFDAENGLKEKAVLVFLSPKSGYLGIPINDFFSQPDSQATKLKNAISEARKSDSIDSVLLF